ncbi:MAG: class I SAM-dependent methyltransferase [Bacteroidota bacterium]
MQEKYDTLGRGYNNTRRADPYLLERLHYLLQVRPGGRYLDVGAGTGNYTIGLSQRGLQMIGVDPSDRMLSVARGRSEAVDWRKGHVEALPLPDNSVDGIVATLTLHHWNDLTRGFKELRRVLHPEGRFVLFGFTPEQMSGYWLNHYFPQMFKDAIQETIPLAEIEESMHKAGLRIVAQEKYFVQPDLQDLFLYSGKYDPQRYFDPKIRQGISFFSGATQTEEVEPGLARMRADMDSGEIEEIMKQYENEEGDYLFLVAQEEP